MIINEASMQDTILQGIVQKDFYFLDYFLVQLFTVLRGERQQYQ